VERLGLTMGAEGVGIMARGEKQQADGKLAR
jgi:hypothetical protein